MDLDRIQQWRPFMYRYISYDKKKTYLITFTCPKCGRHDCRKIGDLDDKYDFWSGHYKCSFCGNEKDGNGNYIFCLSDCFKNYEIVQCESLARQEKKLETLESQRDFLLDMVQWAEQNIADLSTHTKGKTREFLKKCSRYMAEGLKIYDDMVKKSTNP